jgi:hypothetical protein
MLHRHRFLWRERKGKGRGVRVVEEGEREIGKGGRERDMEERKGGSKNKGRKGGRVDGKEKRKK